MSPGLECEERFLIEVQAASNTFVMLILFFFAAHLSYTSLCSGMRRSFCDFLNSRVLSDQALIKCTPDNIFLSPDPCTLLHG